MARSYEFKTTAEFVKWLDGQQTTFDFKTKTYKFDERYQSLAAEDEHDPNSPLENYKIYYVLETTYGTGFSARYTTVILPKEVAELLKGTWKKDGDGYYASYKGRRTLAAIFNILKKLDPEINQQLADEKTRKQMIARKNTVTTRLTSLKTLKSSLSADFAAGALFMDQNYFDALDGMIESLESQAKAIEEVLKD